MGSWLDEYCWNSNEGGDSKRGDGTILNGFIEEDLAEKVPFDQVPRLCNVSGQGGHGASKGGESTGDEATAARGGEAPVCRSFKASLTVATESTGSPGS